MKIEPEIQEIAAKLLNVDLVIAFLKQHFDQFVFILGNQL